MSYGGGFYGRGVSVRPPPHYDQVAEGTLPRDAVELFDPLERSPLRLRPAQSADPLPPPPLPHQPPVGPEFDPSGSEDGAADAELDDPALHHDAALDIKPVHRFIPDSWKNFFRGSGSGKQPWSMSMSGSSSHNNNHISSSTGGVPCSPPASPVPGGSYRGDPYGGGESAAASSYNSRKELLGGGSVSGQTYRTALSYGERVEEYHLRYGYMKSWPGLLRILGCVELLLGAAVFACVCAYVHKDNEWFNMFGYSSPGGGYGGGGGYGSGLYGGSYYTGPKTPFVLVVAGLAWVVTVIVLVMGMTMYYRTILLDAAWWPLTEFTINLALAVLYMAAAIVYVRDTTRGGLCSYPVFNNGINGAFCRTEAGQTAAIIFLFVTMVIYLIGAMVCLKLWRHEAARRYRERFGHEMQPSALRAAHSLDFEAPPPPKHSDQVEGISMAPVHHAAPAAAAKAVPPKILQGAIPSGHIPKAVVVPDYIAKYGTIRSDEERDQYRAVFNDQYAEYKELHQDVQTTSKKFEDMDAMMRSLPQHPSSQMEVDRINRILQDYQKKKHDPTFLEKKERCEYLKNKLSHIKQKIQEYDKVMEWNDGYS